MRSVANNKYVKVLFDKSLCADNKINIYEFCIEYTCDGCVYSATGLNGMHGPKFVSVRKDNILYAESENVGADEKFQIIFLDS